MKEMKITWIVIFLCFFVIVVHAQIQLPRLVSDGMVLQRDKKLELWGWAAKGESVTAVFLTKTYHTKTGDNGKWHLSIPPQKAGGPYEMTFSGSNKITIKNILIGDVWLCSGQSNMEFDLEKAKYKYADEISQAANPQIRQLLVKRIFSFNAVQDIRSDGWLEATPENVVKFTAVGYFFAKALYEKYKIPIGLINSTWGGTPAEAWASEDGLKQYPDYLQKADFFKDSVHIVQTTAKDKLLTDNWLANVKQKDMGYADPNNTWTGEKHDKSSWAPIKMPAFWDTQGLKNQYGVVYLSKEINIPAEDAGKEAILSLGVIDDQDSTFFNGRKIGAETNKYASRRYPVPGTFVKAGKNVITVRIINLDGTGGFNPTTLNPYQLTVEGKNISLSGEWQYKVGAAVTALNPDSLSRLYVQPTALYKGMIAPLMPYAIRGVIWYQGENNVTKAHEYRTLFPDMIRDWRNHWKQPDLPFLYVQLANFLDPVKMPSESKWAELREAQSMTLGLPATGMAVIHDIGEGNNIHPLNKKDVGFRLALAAQKVAYHETNIVYSAPAYESMNIEGNKIVLHFKNTQSGLLAKDSDTLKYFAIAGSDKKFVWANAKINGDEIIVWSNEVAAPVAVRYAWANNPEGANLFNHTGLPVSSFRTDDW